MRKEVYLSDMGEEPEEKIEVALWVAQVGDELKEGDDLLEVTTDKAAFTVPVPMSGRLVEKCVQEGDIISVNQCLCILES